MPVKRKKKQNLLIDLFVISFYSLITFYFAYIFSNIFLFSKPLLVGFISIIPQVIYLGVRKKKNWKKIITGTLVFGLLFGYILEFLAHKSLIWQCSSLVINKLIFGISTYDCVFGEGLMTLHILVFYEHFLDKDITHKISSRLKYAIIPALVVGTLLSFIGILNIDINLTAYPYLFLGIIAILPTILLTIKKPSILIKLVLISIFFFFYYFLLELLAVYFNYWVYNGNNYIGWVQILNLKFPFEELFFWMMFYAATIVAYYEIFIDDEK